MPKAKNKAPTGPTKARVLLETWIDGVPVRPDSVVTLAPELCVALAEIGYIDPDPEAVAHAEAAARGE